ELMKARKSESTHEFWIWLQRAKLYHKQGHRGLYKDSLQKANNLANTGYEKEELAKIRTDLESQELPEDDVPVIEIKEVAAPVSVHNPAPTDEDLDRIVRINKALNSEPNLEYL